MKIGISALWLSVAVILLGGCATRQFSRPQQQAGESIVCVGEEPASLAYTPLRKQPLTLWNTYLRTPATVQYVEGRDYLVDHRSGTLRRTPDSRIPDFQTNILFGQKEFDHTKFPGFGNGRFFVFVDYTYKPAGRWPSQIPQTNFLIATQAKLQRGEPVCIVAFGDSITAGGDATRPDLIFWQRWADLLQEKYPRSRITAINGATGGDSTAQGLQRLQSKVLDQKPDLVLVGFGMNDHNLNGVPVPEFDRNLEEIIGRIRTHTGAEVVLFSAFPPNPLWKFGSHRMREYADATARVAGRMQCAYADVFNNWETLAARKKPEDLLGNNINHPNDFGHWIYFRVLEDVGL